MFSFAEPFKVFIDGEELEKVYGVHISRDCVENDNHDKNIATVFYVKNGSKRMMTVGLEAISFGNS